MKAAAASLLAILALGAPLRADDSSLEKSVVKIFSRAQPADYNQPWAMRWQKSVNGSGFILDGERIMTNAHVVSDQIFVQILKAGDTKKYTATVEHVAHDCEIAVLKVEDADFFDSTVPVRFGDLPYQRNKVAAYGFPTGGNELSITEGIVSRIEVRSYSHSRSSLLTIQTDAAINPGNSGGPVFKAGKVIGISFQTFRGGNTENIGYIVPTPIIRRFLADIEDGKYDGVPSLGIFWQKMENDSLRAKYRMEPGSSGILVTRVVQDSSCWSVVEEGDVIAEIGGAKIANNGTIPFRKKERVKFAHVLSRHQIGGKLTMKVLREGKSLTVTASLKAPRPLVPRPEYDVRPTYYIFGGIVFTSLTHNYMKLWSKWSEAPHWFHRHYSDELPSPERREAVIINQVLPHDINVGYHEIRDLMVARINGRKIGEIRDVIEALKTPADGFHVIEVAHHAGGWTRVVLDAGRAEAATAEILERFRIPSDRSDDLKQSTP